MRILLIALALACSSCSQRSAPDRQLTREFSLPLAASSTLRVIALGDGSEEGAASFGSGIAIAPNMVLTNLHVLQPYYSSDGEVYVLDNSAGFPRAINAVIAVDARLDLALLYVRGITSAPATLALSTPRQLEQVNALGFPASADEIFGRMRDSVSATTGQVTAVDEGPVGIFGPVELVLHTATVNPGNSGGPLFNSCGEVVGVNTLRANPSEVSNAYVASSATEVASFLQSYGVEPAMAQSVCAPTEASGEVTCTYDRSPLEEAISEGNLTTLDSLLSEIPLTCPEILNGAWLSRAQIAREAVATFLAIGGSWRLEEGECADRVFLSLSGLAVWGVAGEQAQFERLVSVSDGSVTTRTVFPESNNPSSYRYALTGERLKIDNLTTNASWEMERCTG